MKNKEAVAGRTDCHLEVEALIQLFKQEFGPAWVQAFQTIVRIDLRRAT